MLLDSNIIIYAMQPGFDWLRQFISDRAPVVSAISYVEVLGYHELSEAEGSLFRQFFATSSVLPIDQDVLDEAVRLRQQRKMTLGDALVAATALCANYLCGGGIRPLHTSPRDQSPRVQRVRVQRQRGPKQPETR